jgi:phosphoglycerate dehydrogenase-like enzyme
MTWNVLITSSPFADPVVGKGAREILGGADFSISHSPRYGPLSEAEVLPLLDGVDAVFASVDKYSAAVLTSPQAARLKVLSRWGVGCDAIDREAATCEVIVIAYTPGLLNEAVAEYALVLLFAVARRVHEGHVTLRAGKWEPAWGQEISGKTLGLIGEAQLRRMKKSAYLINTSRGAIVDETALVRALHEGWIAGAALDAFVTEPLPATHPLVSAPNVLITPHQASFGTETGARVSEAAARAIFECHAGRRPQWVLNPEVFDSPALRMTISE